MNLLAQATKTGLELGDKPIGGAGTVGEITQNIDLSSPEEAANSIVEQISIIIGFITVLGSVFFVIYFMVAAFDWLRAGGDKGKVEKSQQKMVNAAIGLLIMIIATGIIGIVGGVFGIETLNPAATFVDLVNRRTP